MQTLTTNQVEQVCGGSFWEGAAIVGGAILAVALAPVEVPILSVAGIAALGTEVAGGVIMSQ